MPILAWSGLLGALIAMPVLLPELELFIHNDRVIAFSPVSAGHWFDGLLLLSSIHPWTLGTFRTVTYGNLGFYAFIGGAALGLVAMGIRATHAESAERICLGLQTMRLNEVHGARERCDADP